MNTVVAFCAGSLRDAMEEIAVLAREQADLNLKLVFGPSGVLRKRIEAGERADMLASADMGHPQALYAAGLACAPEIFTGNAIRVMAAPGITPPDAAAVDALALIGWLLEDSLRVSTSTPGADPSGDYAWSFFDLAEALLPGAGTALKAKAVQAVGGCGPKTIQGRLEKRPVVRLFLEGETDVFVGYATTAAQTAAKIPGLGIHVPPRELAVECAYGLAVLRTADDNTRRLAALLLSPEGQAVFTRSGFLPAT
jgi:molybdate transport system substrate-binding protein